jgi:hypothetical protein
MSTDELLAAALRLIHRIPYVIAFEKHEQHVLVLAVAHAKRRPLSKPSGTHNTRSPRRCRAVFRAAVRRCIIGS